MIGAPRSSSLSFPIFNRFSLLNSDVPVPSTENVIELVGPINMVPQPKQNRKYAPLLLEMELNLYSSRLNFRLSTQVVLPKSRPYLTQAQQDLSLIESTLNPNNGTYENSNTLS